MGAARYRPYQNFRSSGLEWLGDIPAHWNVLQSRRMFAQRKERAKQGDEQLTSSQKYGIIYQKEFMERENQRVVQVITGSEILKHVKANDFVISMRSFQGGIEWCKYPGSVSSAYIGLIPQKHVEPSFFSYLFKSKQYVQALQSTSNLVRDGQALRYENFSQIALPVVPLPEQTKIAAFLDYETGKIDALIAKQERLIALLEEKRQAVISHAVTKGLDPNVPLRPSGIDWLGDVPEHWDFSYLGFEASIKARLGWKGLKADEYVDEGYIFLATPNIKGREIDMENVNYITQKRYDESPEIALEIGDVLVTKDGSTTGTTNVVRSLPKPATVNSSIAVIRRFGSLESDYLYYFFKSVYTQNVIKRMQDGMGVPHLFQADLRKFRVLLPPQEEQASIAAHLEKAVPKLDDLIMKAQSTIALLQERRTALISAAVTGKIDVRDWQPSQSPSDTNLRTATLQEAAS